MKLVNITMNMTKITDTADSDTREIYVCEHCRYKREITEYDDKGKDIADIICPGCARSTNSMKMTPDKPCRLSGTYKISAKMPNAINIDKEYVVPVSEKAYREIRKQLHMNNLNSFYKLEKEIIKKYHNYVEESFTLEDATY